jgi:hypothetical protein
MNMSNLPDDRMVVPQRLLATLLPVGVILSAGWLFLANGAAPRALQASDLQIQDTDGDGLPDRQETVLGSDPLTVDTDFDGFSDGIEVALQTDPTLFSDSPDSCQLSLGMSARGEAGKLKIFIALHSGDGILHDKIIRLGVLVGGQIVYLPIRRLAPYMVSSSQPTPTGGVLLTMDIHLPETYVQTTGAATVFAMVGITGADRFARLGKVDLSLVQGVMMLRMPYPGGSGGPTAIPEGAMINRPIPLDGEVGVPVDWESGKVCFQMSEVVGTVGSTVIHQVTHAECESGWDTYCASDCTATVGNTFTTVDPGSLLGG